MNSSYSFEVGKGTTEKGFGLVVLYHPPRNVFSAEEQITVQWGEGRHADGPTLPPKRILEYRPHIFHEELRDGVLQTKRIEQEPAGWFERKCDQANCVWFVPFVKRMAAGETVTIEEIEAAYRAYNGELMPCKRSA